jgi:hypothetical protein
MKPSTATTNPKAADHQETDNKSEDIPESVANLPPISPTILKLNRQTGYEVYCLLRQTEHDLELYEKWFERIQIKLNDNIHRRLVTY